ncbi:MAG: 23S rRNA (uracil(1939)-C(5))-methyltransferase RlmD [Ferruginibacter sp.]
MKKRKKPLVLENVLLTDYAAEGKALFRQDGKVIFVSGGVPGDRVDVLLFKNKKDWGEGRVLNVLEPAPDRVQPFCVHFGTCGGCKWQMLPYEKQLVYKQQEAADNLERIGKIQVPEWLPITGANPITHYRNKLEFTACNRRYRTEEDIRSNQPIIHENALGFHAPRIFDKAINITECHLMDPINNLVRNTVRTFAETNNLSFYDIKAHTGWLRNIIVRYTTTGELMVNVCINNEDTENRIALLDHLLTEVPAITTLLYTINPKWNDSIYDLTPQVYFGKGYVTEKLGALEFIISPKSFFQTNTKQAETLYSITKSFAGLTGQETVYDLYCGTGSIGLFLSDQAKKVIGVEVIDEAIEDAKKNAALNKIDHADFFAGDVIKICDDVFFAKHGKPDVIITDPPRAGMHEKLVKKLLEIESPRIVYVSCNTATQARDLQLLAEKYQVVKAQAVDMFPHTHHIECVVLLERTPA